MRSARRSMIIVGCVSAIFLTMGGSALAQGELTPLKGKCAILNLRTCPVQGMESPQQMVVSPDGRNIYVVNSRSLGITIFDRNRSTGFLKQKPGSSGCVVFEKISALTCAVGSVITHVDRIVASSDGRNIYALGKTKGDVPALINLQRDTDGSLTQDTDPAGCLSQSTLKGTCSKLEVPDLSISAVMSPPSSSYVLALSASKEGDATVVSTLARDATTGRLSSTPTSCLSNTASAGCTRTTLPLTTAVSSQPLVSVPDGRTTYLVGYRAITALATDANGKLSPASCVAAKKLAPCSQEKTLVFRHGLELTVAPNGRNVYTISLSGDTADDNGLGVITVFNRNSTSGKLTRKTGKSGCLASPGRRAKECVGGKGFPAPLGITITPNGRNAYVNSYTHNAPLTAFSRQGSGELAQLTGAAGCFVSYPYRGCTDLRDNEFGASAFGLVVSPDSKFLYVLTGYPYDVVHSFAIKQGK